MICTASQLAAFIRYKPRKPEVNEVYRRFIRSFPCVGCGTMRRIEFMHTGPRGLGQKSDDSQGLPGCPACHRTGPQALHKIGPVRFQLVHTIEFPALIEYFQHLWSLKNERPAQDAL